MDKVGNSSAYTVLKNYAYQSVVKPKTLDISTQTLHAVRFPALSLGFYCDDASYVVAVALELFWVKNPGEENNIHSDFDMSRVLVLQVTGSD